jgi:hypothetical protein
VALLAMLAHFALLSKRASRLFAIAPEELETAVDPAGAVGAGGEEICQSALKNDPGSALNFDPARDDGSGAMVMRFDGSGPVLEAPALVAGLDDVTVMG